MFKHEPDPNPSKGFRVNPRVNPPPRVNPGVNPKTHIPAHGLTRGIGGRGARIQQERDPTPSRTLCRGKVAYCTSCATFPLSA